MSEVTARPFDLEARSELFAREVPALVKRCPFTLANRKDLRQLVKSSGSVAANSIETNEALSRKDFVMRARISRKEAKESAYWRRLIDTGADPATDRERRRLEEARELVCMLTTIIQKTRVD